MKIKINGTEYFVTKRTTKNLDAYYKKGVFVDEVKHDEAYKYEANVDGQIIGICKKSKYFMLAIGSAILISCCVVAAPYVSNIIKDVGNSRTESTIDTGEEKVSVEDAIPVLEDPILLRYNKFCTCINGNIDLRFINGEYDAEIKVSGENITCDVMNVGKKEEVLYVPIKVDTNNELINAELIYTCERGTTRYPLVIENISDTQAIDENITLQDEEVIYE